MSYFDVYMAPVKKIDRERYLSHLREILATMKEHGVIRVVEFWGDDVSGGEITSYRSALKLSDDETVVAGYIEWASKEAREAGWSNIMADERMQDEALPFDGKRLIYAGFEKVFDQ